MIRSAALLCALAFLLGPATAQNVNILLEACNGMQDPEKRLECLKAAVGAPGAPKEAEALTEISSAFSNIRSSLDVGISYNNYQVALLELARAISAYKQKAPESPASSHFDGSLEAYKDAATFWERSINFYARRDNNLSYAGGLPIGLNGMEWLVSKYSLPTSRSDLLGFHSGLPVASTRSTLWNIAAARANEGLAKIKPGEKQEAPKASEKIEIPLGPPDDEIELGKIVALAKSKACNDEPAPRYIGPGFVRFGANEYQVTCKDGATHTYGCVGGVCSWVR